ncbi:hypothetical protein BsWGS_29128 [Bradybaena similaris]
MQVGFLRVLSCLSLAGLVWNAVLGQDVQCKGQPDDKVVLVNCTGYTKCRAGKSVVLTCQPGTVLERDTLTCKLVGTGNTICGTSGQCFGTGYLPSPNCQSFFHCQNGFYHENSHIYCPDNLLFDGISCNYHYNVPPPCGTYTPPPPTPPSTPAPRRP